MLENNTQVKKSKLKFIVLITLVIILITVAIITVVIVINNLNEKRMAKEYIDSLKSLSINKYGSITLGDVYGKLLKDIEYEFIEFNSIINAAKIQIYGFIGETNIVLVYHNAGGKSYIENLFQYPREWNAPGIGIIDEDGWSRNVWTLDGDVVEDYLFLAYTGGYDNFMDFLNDNNIELFIAD